MILFIFRIIALASVVGLGAYFILSPSSTNSLSVQIRSAEKDLADLKVRMAADKNASEQLELEVSRSSSAYTQRLNDATSAKEKLEIEQEAGQPKSEELDQQIADAEGELETLGKELAEASAPLQDIEIQSKPLTERGEALEGSIKQLGADLAAQKQKADAVAASLALLETKRRSAEESFHSEKERLSAEVKKPFHMHYADKKEVFVRNKVPSGKGIFIDAGYADGLRDGMEFLAEKASDRTAIPFRARLGLVQNRYSYLEFMPSDESGVGPPPLEESEKILLTRSGKISLLDDLDESNQTRLTDTSPEN